MTAMPQLVSIFNAVGGGAAALVAIHDYINLAGGTAGVAEATTVTTLLDVIIGAVTFSGSIIAAGKLQGLINAAPDHLPRLAARQHRGGGGRDRRRHLPDRHPERRRAARSSSSPRSRSA